MVVTHPLSPPWQLHPCSWPGHLIAKETQDFGSSPPLGLVQSSDPSAAGSCSAGFVLGQVSAWPGSSSSLHAAENIIKQLHPAGICQENQARDRNTRRVPVNTSRRLRASLRLAQPRGGGSLEPGPPSPGTAALSSGKEPGARWPRRMRVGCGRVGGHCAGTNPLFSVGWNRCFPHGWLGRGWLVLSSGGFARLRSGWLQPWALPGCRVGAPIPSHLISCHAILSHPMPFMSPYPI